MASAGADFRSEIRCAREKFAIVAEVESLFVKDTEAGVSLCVVVSEKNITVEERIYEQFAEVMQQFPETRFDFRLLSRRGRPLSDIATVSGYPVLQRTA